jgi:hypothetical protein
MSESFPPPPLQPIEQFQVKDGLLINAERWRRAHNYHQQRQSMLFQSLNQPGIVTGLGVHIVTAPEDVPAKYRDQRWLEIQPGLAIDLAGNLIVVPHPIPYRIVAGDIPTPEPLTIYLSISHVDPKTLVRTNQPEIIQETFRIDESTQPPTGRELEVCRIHLKPGQVELEQPTDVFSPQVNQIDLRFRLYAQARPQGWAEIALVQPLHYRGTPAETAAAQNYLTNLAFLLESLESLYPALGSKAVQQVSLADHSQAHLSKYNLLFASGEWESALAPVEIDQIKAFTNSGGTFVIESVTEDRRPFEFINDLSQHFDITFENIEGLSELHPIKRKPFLFSTLPTFNNQKIQILYGAGVVVLIGGLSTFWAPNQNTVIPRTDLRIAQELGINLLYFASQRKVLSQLLTPELLNAEH